MGYNQYDYNKYIFDNYEGNMNNCKFYNRKWWCP